MSDDLGRTVPFQKPGGLRNHLKRRTALRLSENWAFFVFSVWASNRSSVHSQKLRGLRNHLKRRTALRLSENWAFFVFSVWASNLSSVHSQKLRGLRNQTLPLCFKA